MANPTLLPVIRDLKNGRVGILPTDTIYGIVGSALRPAAVQRIYLLRERNPKKPMIILIGSVRDLVRFGVAGNASTRQILRNVWPGTVSVVLPIAPRRRAARRTFRYLHRGTNTLAFRLPKPAWLRSLLKTTGPLVAPSANFEGEPPSRTIARAKRYFGDRVDFYVDMGRSASKPSRLLRIENGAVIVLRK